MGGNLSVAVDFHTRETFEQVLDHSIGLGVVGVCIIFHCVLHHLDRRLCGYYTYFP